MKGSVRTLTKLAPLLLACLVRRHCLFVSRSANGRREAAKMGGCGLEN